MFDGEVAWVTGSSKGIGRAIALDLAREGCDIVVHYNSGEADAREVVEQIEALGRQAVAVRGDVSEGRAVDQMIREVEERFGRVDVLVNNAGSFVERRTLEEMTEDVWDRVMAVNLKSVYLCSQAVLPLMKRQGGGRIVNISSVSARIGGSADSIAYSTAKGGVSTLTRAMSNALLPYNILVNAVAPGRIDTPLHDTFTPAEKREEGAKKVPLGREGTPEEVSGAVVYLASDRASYVVGETIEVNGGLWMG